jgi:hypothetical protein
MQDIEIDQRVFLAMREGGSSGVTGKVTGFVERYGMQHVIVETDSGNHWKAPISHAQEA